MFSFPKFRSGQVLEPELTSFATESSATLSIPSSEQKPYSAHTLRRKRSSRKSSRSRSPEIIRKASVKGAVPQLKEPQPLLVPVPSDVSAANNLPPNMEQIIEESGSMTREQLGSGSPIKKHRQQEIDDENPPKNKTVEDNSPVKYDSHKEPTIASLQSPWNTSISGRPFARVPSTKHLIYDTLPSSPLPSPPMRRDEKNYFTPPHAAERDSSIPVGVSRLHLVEIPELIMKPIYWNPVNDSSNVLRATWFYQETMLPVPADIANRLEIGYEDMKPYLTTYQDELLACIEHGPAAETKVVYKLFPEDKKGSRPTTANDAAANLDHVLQEADEPQPRDADNMAVDPHQNKRLNREYRSYSVIYTNAKNAQLLRPSALPSASRNRAPLKSIRRGQNLGIAVVRGFDRKMWYRLYPDTMTPEKAEVSLAKIPKSGTATAQSDNLTCPLCDADTQRANVTDLVLVIHGIGQKLSERVDSYHFTHAINGLRRDFNLQASQPGVRKHLRDDAEIMVLPINWRLTVSFDDRPKAGVAQNSYELKDITPGTLPAVRSVISDVMLDIPYYMSHHKQKMIAAVVREANRVYRLWCRNNPGFEDYGRVHVIAHSLGSAMAMDILSQQPTVVPPLNMSDANQDPDEKQFEFNTTNFFCCGSPSGFFLLLNNANLIPRKGRQKKGMEAEDASSNIASEDTKYGCLAVENVYNIMHKNDPVAYQQNACVDSTYAATLQPALIPSATQSVYAQLFGSLRGTKPFDAYSIKPGATRPSIAQFPSTVELETHNFSREEIAEKRMYLLNENGQIDYFLQSGGGPLEIQYLNMLSAHSSYWYLADFARFLVVEIGRRRGREYTIPALRAVKRRSYKRGEGI